MAFIVGIQYVSILFAIRAVLLNGDNPDGKALFESVQWRCSVFTPPSMTVSSSATALLEEKHRHSRVV